MTYVKSIKKEPSVLPLKLYSNINDDLRLSLGCILTYGQYVLLESMKMVSDKGAISVALEAANPHGRLCIPRRAGFLLQKRFTVEPVFLSQSTMKKQLPDRCSSIAGPTSANISPYIATHRAIHIFHSVYISNV